MAGLIPKVEREEKESFTIRLPRALVEQLDKYVSWVGGERSYVIQSALAYVFERDKDFQRVVDSLVPDGSRAKRHEQPVAEKGSS